MSRRSQAYLKRRRTSGTSDREALNSRRSISIPVNAARPELLRWLCVRIVVGTAGWSIASKDAAAFPEDGSALERYSSIFGGVEINSSFHRSHRESTWARWASSVPEGFRFAVKLPKTITHLARLVDSEPLIAIFADEVRPLATKLAVLLVQTPPKLEFEPKTARRFFTHLRSAIGVQVVCEPRHASWFDEKADSLLADLQVARVAADPAPLPAAASPGGWRGFGYWRLHGSPRMYRSAYSDLSLALYADAIRAESLRQAGTWCIFDNTAGSEATGNALSLAGMLGLSPQSPRS
jgi:uncharacterized protein YecE (DUF72 family)